MSDLVRLALPRKIYLRLVMVQRALTAEKGRRVTLHETVEILLDRAAEREEQGA